MGKKSSAAAAATAPPATTAKAVVADKSSKKDKKAAPAVEAPKKEKKSKKVVKAPTPPPVESSSEEESSDEESEAAPTEDVKVTAPAADAESSDEESSDDEEDAPKTNGTAAPVKEESSDDSDSSDDEATPAAAAAAAPTAESSDEDSSDDDDEEVEEEKPKTAKRKAEAEPEPVAKKAKVEETDGVPASSTVFVGKLSWNVDNDWLKSEFESIGEIVSCRVQWDHDQNRSKGFGFVEFASPELAQKAVTEMADKEIDGRAINIDIAAGRSEKKPREARAAAFGDKKSDPADTLFIGNLPFSASEDQVYELFAEYGEVQSVRLPTDRESGAPKGFGYVTMADIAQATKALDTMTANQAQIDGRTIRLDYSGPKPPREEGFGGGRGGGRGGFGGDRGGRGRGGFGGDRGGRGRGAPRGGARTGGIQESSGQKMSFD